VVHPAAPAASANPDQVLVPRLTALRLVPSTAQISREALVPGNPIVIEGLPWLDPSGVASVAEPYLNRPLTRGRLTELIRLLVLESRKHNRPVVDVYAPPQDVSNGVVQLIVLVGKLGKVKVEGNQWFAGNLFTRDIRVQPGQQIQGKQLLEDMDLINQNPFRQVDLVYSRGDEFGLTNVVLRVQDKLPDRVYVGYDDTGNESTGLGRVFAGLNLGNVFKDDQQFSYQYERSTDFNRFWAQSASYAVPLPWRNTIEVFGDWAEAKTEPDAGLFGLTGSNWEVGLRYTIPLPMVGVSYTQSVNFGADYKWSNNDLNFGGTQVFTSPVNVAQGVLGYTGVKIDADGSTQGSVTGFFSPGGIGGLNHDHNFAVQREGAPANYSYYQATLTRVQKLVAGYTLVLTSLGQFSPDRMVPGNEFGLGGASSVRGYDERIVNGDDGISGQLELRTPPRHYLHSIPDSTQFLVFVDAGRDWENKAISGEVDNTLASVGPGIRMNVSNHGAIKVDYGYQLQRLSGTRHGRLHVSAILSF
jgi:hemolysin activation/secretion protein